MAKPDLFPMGTIAPVTFQKYERYLPTAFDESLSLLEKVNKIIHYMNEIGEITNDMINRWNEVYTWIMGEGLEDAVTAKLEEWLADGTLSDIINETLFGDLRNSIAERLNISNYYDGLELFRHYDDDHQTFITVTKIPYRDKDNNIIKLKQGFPKDEPYPAQKLETARTFASRNQATFVCNASTFSTTQKRCVGIVIQDGQVLQDNARQSYNWTLAIDDNNILTCFSPETTGAAIANLGYKTALTAFVPIIRDSAIVDSSILEARDEFNEHHARQWIGQDTDNNIYIFHSDGRRMQRPGMTISETATWTKTAYPNIKFAFHLDGGGSSQNIYYNMPLNGDADGSSTSDNTIEREVANFLYIAKEKKDNSGARVFSPIGDALDILSDRVDIFENKYSYIPNNRIKLDSYLINGYTAYGSEGSAVPMMYITGNNLAVMLGTVAGGTSGQPFLQLPGNIVPVYSSHHLVPGNTKGEVYKVVVTPEGKAQIYYWNDSTTQLDYIRLDGITFPIRPIYDNKLVHDPVDDTV